MTAAYPSRLRNSKVLFAVSAVTYVVLGLAFGIHAAFTLVVASAIIALWVAAARRFPVVGWFTYVFFNGFVLGLIDGLFAYRGGYRSCYRRSYRRR